MSNTTKGGIQRLKDVTVDLSDETTLGGENLRGLIEGGSGGDVSFNDLTDVPQAVSDLADGTTVAVSPQANIADLTEAPTDSDINSILAALRAADILSA